MKGKVKTITIFLMVFEIKCEFLEELQVSLVNLQDTVDKISLEQSRTIKKVDKLEEKIEKLETKVITVDDLNEVKNNMIDVIAQFKNEMNTLTPVQNSGNGCIEAESNVANNANATQDSTNLTAEHIDALKHVAKEVEEKGKSIIHYKL